MLLCFSLHFSLDDKVVRRRQDSMVSEEAPEGEPEYFHINADYIYTRMENVSE